MVSDFGKNNHWLRQNGSDGHAKYGYVNPNMKREILKKQLATSSEIDYNKTQTIIVKLENRSFPLFSQARIRYVDVVQQYFDNIKLSILFTMCYEMILIFFLPNEHHVNRCTPLLLNPAQFMLGRYGNKREHTLGFKRSTQ